MEIKIIKTEADYQQSLKRLEEIFDSPVDTPEGDEAELLCILIEKYEEKPEIDRIYASIYCETKSQKGILIGKGGSMLKKIGTEARLELEKIAEKKVYLELNVKIEKDWRKKQKSLKDFGYENA